MLLIDGPKIFLSLHDNLV